MKTGKLDRLQSLFTEPRKPRIEFYDTQANPHEVNNLADSVRHREQVSKFRSMLHRWIDETGDLGRFPESEKAGARDRIKQHACFFPVKSL